MGLMNQENESESLFSDINVTPLVDVMLVLLIIFMITAPFMVETIGVNLPKASAGAAIEQKEPLVVSISSDNSLHVGKKKLTKEEFKVFLQENQRIKDQEALFIEADEEIKHKALVEVMSLAQDAGVAKINIMLQKP